MRGPAGEAILTEIGVRAMICMRKEETEVIQIALNLCLAMLKPAKELF